MLVYERHREFAQTATAQETEWSRGSVDVWGEQRARAQMLASSIGEDRATLLGFTMMAFSVLMMFVVGITVVKPYIGRYFCTCEVKGEQKVFKALLLDAVSIM